MLLLFFFLIPICSLFSNFTVLKVPGVKKTLGIPEIPVAPPTTTSATQSPFSIFPALKQATSATRNGSSSIPDEASKHSNKKISSASVISQRLRSLEKQVKGRKKNKKWGKFTIILNYNIYTWSNCAQHFVIFYYPGMREKLVRTLYV